MSILSPKTNTGHASRAGATNEQGGIITTILGISGSLRKGSLNTSLLHAAAGLMPETARSMRPGSTGSIQWLPDQKE
jgi:hypothetical protein